MGARNRWKMEWGRKGALIRPLGTFSPSFATAAEREKGRFMESLTRLSILGWFLGKFLEIFGITARISEEN